MQQWWIYEIYFSSYLLPYFKRRNQIYKEMYTVSLIISLPGQESIGEINL